MRKPQDNTSSDEPSRDDRDLWHVFNESLRLGRPMVITESTRGMPKLDFEYLRTALGSTTIILVSVDNPEVIIEQQASSFFQSIISGDPEAKKWKIKVSII